MISSWSDHICFLVKEQKWSETNHKENETFWHTSEQCALNVLKSHCTATFFFFFFGTECINELVVFYPRWNVGCQQSSHQKLRYHLLPGASGSVLFFQPNRVSGSCMHAHQPRSKLSLQRAPSNLSQLWMMWECSLQSPRCFQSAGLLLSSNSLFLCWVWSVTMYHKKHVSKVKEKTIKPFI